MRFVLALLALLAPSLAHAQALPSPAIRPPVNDNQAANKGYVDGLASGLLPRFLSMPYGSLNTSKEGLKVLVGGVTDAQLLPGLMASTSAIVGAVAVPVGSYAGAEPKWPDAGGSFYGINYNPSAKTGLGLYTLGGIGANGAYGYGANINVINGKLFEGTGTTGFNFPVMYGLEVDTNLYARPGGAPITGSVAGIKSILNALATTSGAMNAFDVGSYASIPWKVGYATSSGAATVGVSLGAVAGGANSNGQPINMTAIGPDGLPRLAQIFPNVNGTIVMLNGGGDGSLSFGAAYPQLQQAASATVVGSKISTTATTGGNANLILETGTAGSFASFAVLDGNVFSITAGAGLPGGIALSPGSGYITLGGRVIEQSGNVPSTSSSACIPGQHAWDTNYEYRCVATNTWRRAALTSW